MKLLLKNRLQNCKPGLIAVLMLLFCGLSLKAKEYTYGGVVYLIEDESSTAIPLRYDGTSETVKIVDKLTYQEKLYDVFFDRDKDLFTNQYAIFTVDASGVNRLDPEIKFSGCHNLRTVIPSKDWEIGEYQYYNCMNLDLRTVIIPTTRSIGAYAFAMETPQYVGELHGVDLSIISSQTAMHNRLYSVIDLTTQLTEDEPESLYNSGIESLDLSEATCIMLDGYSSDGLFYLQIPKLMTLVLSNSNLRLEDSYMPTTLENIYLSGVIYSLLIGNYNNRVFTVDSDNVEVIKDLTLGGGSYESLDMKGKVREMNLYSLKKLKTLAGCEGVTYASIEDCPLLESISLPDIENFYDASRCKSLKEIYLGASLKEMNQTWTFDNSDNIQDFIYGGNLEQWLAVRRNGAEDEHPKDAPLSKVKNFWYGHGNAKLTNLTELNAGNIGNATEIGPEAFTAYLGLTKIDLPASVKVIGPSSFAACTNLKDVKINAERIEQYAFYGVYGIESLVIGNELKYIGPAFSEASQPVTVVNYLSDAGKWANIERTNTVYLDPYDPGAGVGNICRGTFMIPTKEMLFMGQPLVTLELNDPKVVSKGAFANIQSLSTIKVNHQSGYTEFQDKAFYGCSNLKEIIITPPSGTRAANADASGYVIGKEAFAYCSSLDEIPMLTNLKSIASNALTETAWIKNRPLNSVIYLTTELGRTAYTYNGSPEENSTLMIEQGTEAINDEAFASNRFENFTSVSLPQSLRYIGNDAFNGTNFGGTLALPASVETLKTNYFSGKIDCLKFEDSDTPLDIELCNFSHIKSIYYGRNFTETSRCINLDRSESSLLEKVEYGDKVTHVTSANGIPYWGDDVKSIYSYGTVPPECELSEYDEETPVGLLVNKEICTLYVPAECIEVYKAAPGWKTFKNILPIDTSAIKDIMTDGSSELHHYDLNGHPILPDAKGIHIIVNKDGSSNKVLVK